MNPTDPSFASLVRDALNAAVTPERVAAKVQAHVDRAVDAVVTERE